MNLGVSWGMTDAERRERFGCDARCPTFDAALFRGVSVRAPAPLLFRWLCQLRAAPYSYDWLDNRLRRSPRALIPGLDVLAVGQKVMRIFELVAFEPDRSITVVNRKEGGARRLFGEVWITYRIALSSAGGCRLLVKVLVRYPPGRLGWFLRRLLPLGDLIMMRRQLRNLKRLAERDAGGRGA